MSVYYNENDPGAAEWLRHGRHSGLWFFNHQHDTDCAFDHLGASIMFNTQEEAIKVERIFI